MFPSQRRRDSWPSKTSKLVFLFLFFFGTALGARADDSVEDDLLILELRLRNLILSDGVFALQRDGQVYLPLAELFQVLELAVEVDPEGGTAAGWVLEERRTFALDVAQRQVMLAGRAEGFPAGAVVIEDGDIYAELSLISDWIPVDFRVDLRNLMVFVAPREPLPVELRLERERKRERALAARRGLLRPNYPRAETPYRWLSWPFADVTLDGAYARDPEGSEWHHTYSVFSTMDVARMGGELFVSGSDGDPVSEVTASLGRVDPEGRVLGPLHATELSAGDVFSPQSPLFTRGQRGRGVTVSSYPLDRPDEFDRTTLRGDAAPGWEVELYRNDTLLDFQVVGPDGRYEFRDVPLQYGLNELRIVSYGRQGQKTERGERVYVGPSMIEPGRGHFLFSLNQHHEDLVPLPSDDDRDPIQGDPRLYAEYEKGVGRRFSLSTSLASIPLEDEADVEQHAYLGVGGRAALLGSFTTLDLGFDMDGGTAAQLGFRTAVGSWSVLLERAQFRNFVSERVENGDRMENRTRARVDGYLPDPIRISLSLDGEREERRSGRNDTRVSNRLGTSRGWVSVTNEVDWEIREPSGDPVSHRVDGGVLVSGHRGSTTSRLSLNYAVHPEMALENVTASLDWRPREVGNFSFDVNRTLNGEKRTRLSAGWNRCLRWATLGFRGTYVDDGTFSAGATMDFSLGRSAQAGNWSISGESMASKGAVTARVVLDRNGNGLVDEGDQPVEGVTFRVNNTARSGVRTGAAGCALLSNLSATRPSDIVVETGSLENPFWIVEPEGFSVVSHPGASSVVVFLVQETGEVDGTVFLRHGEVVRGVSRVRLQLLDKDGEVVQSAHSAFDGFYLFEKVPLGRYTVRIDPAQYGEYGVVTEASREVELRAEEEVASGVDWVLEERNP